MSSHDEATYDLLVGYVLDALDPAELQTVQRLLAQQPELHHTVAQLRRSVHLLGYGLAEVEPPADLRQRTLAYATGRSQRQAPRTSPTRSRWTALLAGLAALLLIVAGVGWLQWNSARREAAQLRNDIAQLEAEYQRLIANVVQPQALVQLTGEQGHGTLIQRSPDAAVLVAQLPVLPADRVYQVWTITGDTPPASVGTLSMGADGYGTLDLTSPTLATADIVAITNEPAPGSAAPTSDPLLAGQR